MQESTRRRQSGPQPFHRCPAAKERPMKSLVNVAVRGLWGLALTALVAAPTFAGAAEKAPAARSLTGVWMRLAKDADGNVPVWALTDDGKMASLTVSLSDEEPVLKARGTYRLDQGVLHITIDGDSLHVPLE